MNVQIISAKYCDGNLGKYVHVKVRIDGHTLVILSEDGLKEIDRWHKSVLRYDQPGSNYLLINNKERGDAQLEFDKSEDIRYLKSIRGGLMAHMFRHRGFMISMGVAVAAMLLFVMFLGPIANFTAERIPPSWEQTLGDSMMKSYEDQKCGTEDHYGLIRQLSKRLAEGGSQTYQWKIMVIDSDVENAFAFPGGHIVVHKGLLEKMTTAEEFAGVIAHEMAHVEKRHVTKSVVRAMALSVIMAFVFGDPTGLGAISPDLVAQIVGNAHSRDAELEADREAIRSLKYAGISSKGLKNFFERHLDGQGAEHLELFSTHPTFEGRIAQINKHIYTARSLALSPNQWREIQTMCSGAPASNGGITQLNLPSGGKANQNPRGTAAPGDEQIIIDRSPP